VQESQARSWPATRPRTSCIAWAVHRSQSGGGEAAPHKAIATPCLGPGGPSCRHPVGPTNLRRVRAPAPVRLAAPVVTHQHNLLSRRPPQQVAIYLHSLD